MINGDEELKANYFVIAEGGLDRGRLGNGYQGAAILFSARRATRSYGIITSRVHVVGSKYGISGISDITKRLPNLGTRHDGSMEFYPLFPWLVRLVAYVSRSYLASGFIVSGIASVIAAVLLRRLVHLDYPASVAMRSVWFLLIFPTAYFLHIGYSEALFLALALACILAARGERWWLAGVLGAFCWMTRATGAVLVPTLAVEAAQQYWVRRRSCSQGPVGCSAWNWKWLSIAIVPAGFAVYLLINWSVAGDPFAFLQARKTLFDQSFASPLTGIRQAIWAPTLLLEKPKWWAHRSCFS